MNSGGAALDDLRTVEAVLGWKVFLSALRHGQACLSVKIVTGAVVVQDE